VKYARALSCFIHWWGAISHQTLLCFVSTKVWHAPCCVNVCCFPPSFLSGSSCDTIALCAIPIIFCSFLAGLKLSWLATASTPPHDDVPRFYAASCSSFSSLQKSTIRGNCLICFLLGNLWHFTRAFSWVKIHKKISYELFRCSNFRYRGARASAAPWVTVGASSLFPGFHFLSFLSVLSPFPFPCSFPSISLPLYP